MIERRIRFGVKTSQAGVSYEEVLRIWRAADALPVFEHAWLWDHMIPLRGDAATPALEAWTLLAALAAQTERLRLGVIVTSNRLRAPALLAKMAATVDQIAGGRLIFGIGAGGSAVTDPEGLAMVHREFDAYGIDVVSPGEAVGALAESVALIRRMWAETEPFDFEGRYYRLRGAICEPKPIQRPGPPVMIASAGPRSLGIAAEHADIWVYSGEVADFRSKSAILDERCAAIGRDPASIARLTQFIIRGGEAALPGIRDRIAEYVEAGATDIVLAPVPPTPDDVVRWLADEIVAPVRAQFGVDAA